MLFKSIDFAFFLPIVFTLYWFVFNKNLKHQNLLVLAASYLFYGWWDWRFLSLIILSSSIDFTVAHRLKFTENRLGRKTLLWVSILANLGFLGFFKYYNFFLDNFVSAFSFFGYDIKVSSLNIILPVGISFYTFQTLSYTIDVYRRKIEPTTDIIAFFSFVSFFPQLVAGPIERATNLLPQFYRSRSFDHSKAVDGMRQILWGLVKKILIADNCAKYVDIIFSNSTDYSGTTLVLGGILFTFQVYSDFSGYSDIAIGTSRLFGINLMQNFAFPYFSRDIAEFWRRWHISLTTWFRDYLYIPLGGSRSGTSARIRNLFIVFTASGLWHGANWTYVIWGALNAAYILPLILTNNNRNNIDIVARGKLIPNLKDALSILFTFALTVFAMIIFRSTNVTHAKQYIRDMFAGLFHYSSYLQTIDFFNTETTLALPLTLASFFAIEWVGKENQYAIEHLPISWNKSIRWLFYSTLIFAIYYLGNFEDHSFIYFQF